MEEEIKKPIPEKQGENKEVGYKKPPKEYQWKPGQSGNPLGRPKFSLVSILSELLQEVPEKEKEGKAKVLMRKAIELALAGDTAMIKDIINRIDGCPKQSIALGIDDTISEVKIEIKKPKDENIKPTSDNSVSIELGGIPEQEA